MTEQQVEFIKSALTTYGFTLKDGLYVYDIKAGYDDYNKCHSVYSDYIDELADNLINYIANKANKNKDLFPNGIDVKTLNDWIDNNTYYHVSNSY